MDNNNNDNANTKFIFEDFLNLYPKMSLKSEYTIPPDKYLIFFNKKNSYTKRKSSILIENLKNKINSQNIGRLSSINIKSNEIASLKNLIIKKNSANNIIEINHNHILNKIIENEEIDKSINLENEDLFLINKGIEQQKRGVKRTGDVKKALEHFLNKSELIERLLKNANNNVQNNQHIINNDKNNKEDKENIIEKNMQYKIRNLVSKLAQKVFIQKYDKNKFIIRMNDIGDETFFLISGRLSILKPVEYKHIQLSYEDYFKYALSLLTKNENHILKKVLESNWHFIKIYDEENLIDIVKYYIQNRISILGNISDEILEKNKIEELTLEKIENYLEKFKLKLENFNLTKKKIIVDINDIIYEPEKKGNNINIKFKITSYFRKLFKPSKQTQILFSPYNFLFDANNNDKVEKNYYVTIYKYEIFMFLEPGAFFGEMFFENEDKRRNATIRTEEDSVLISLNEEQYENLLLDNNKKINILQVNFLCSHFFFNNISLVLFNKYYYPMFKLINKTKDEIIFRQEDMFNSLFLLKEGEIRYEIYASIVDIHELIVFLINSLQENEYLNLDKNYVLILKENYLKNKNFINFKNNNIILNEKIKEKNKYELSICNSYEILGIYEYFLKVGHLCTCYVASKKAKLFELSKSSLNEIISVEKEIISDYYHLAFNKILSLIRRLFSIENIFIKQTEYKIKTNFFDINNSNFYSELREENIKNNQESNAITINDEFNEEKNTDDQIHFFSKEFNLGNLEESIFKRKNYSQIKFNENFSKSNSLNSPKNQIYNLKKIKSRKISNLKKNFFKCAEEEKNILKKNAKKSGYYLKSSSSSIINYNKNNDLLKNNSTRLFHRKQKSNPKTVINIGNSCISLPQLKRKLLNLKKIRNKSLISIVKNDYLKSELFEKSQNISPIKNISNKKEKYLPNIKIGETPGFNTFLKKIKNNINLSKIRNNSEYKLNQSKEIIINVSKKDNVLTKYIQNYYQKRKNKGYLAIVNSSHNTMVKHKLLTKK